MPGVIDFVILRQTYDVAMSRNWIVGAWIWFTWIRIWFLFTFGWIPRFDWLSIQIFYLAL